jgi:hypothetical protein
VEAVVVVVGVVLAGVVLVEVDDEVGELVAAAFDPDDPDDPPVPVDDAGGVGDAATGALGADGVWSSATMIGATARLALPVPITTPKASVPSTATAAARGDGIRNGSVHPRTGDLEPRSSGNGARCRRAIDSSAAATLWGSGLARMPHSTQ